MDTDRIRLLLLAGDELSDADWAILLRDPIIEQIVRQVTRRAARETLRQTKRCCPSIESELPMTTACPPCDSDISPTTGATYDQWRPELEQTATPSCWRRPMAHLSGEWMHAGSSSKMDVPRFWKDNSGQLWLRLSDGTGPEDAIYDPPQQVRVIVYVRTVPLCLVIADEIFLCHAADVARQI